MILTITFAALFVVAVLLWRELKLTRNALAAKNTEIAALKRCNKALHKAHFGEADNDFAKRCDWPVVIGND